VKEMSVEVEVKQVVRLYVRRVELARARKRGSQAVAMPPREPSASTTSKTERFGGRKDRALNGSREANLVS
jgi:hypothetical protein